MGVRSDSSDSAARLWHPAWVGVLGVLLYLTTIRYGLTRFDDPWLIRDNALLHQFSFEGLRRVFFDFSVEQRLQLGAEYLPVRDASVMLDFAVWGDWFGGHHLTQVLLYGALCALAATLVQELFAHRALAWWVGAAFALHPVHVEAVAWLSERKGVLGAVLLFGACIFGVRYLRVGHFTRLIGSLSLLAVAILSKGHMLAGAAALAMTAMWMTEMPSRRRWALAVGAFAVGCLTFVPIYFAGRSVGMVQPYHGGSLQETVLLLAQVHGKYLQLMSLGGPYSIAYPIGADAFGLERLVLDLVGSGALVILGFLAIRAIFQPKRRNAATFGLGWWLIFLVPVSHIVLPLQNLLADRYLFVGSWGLLLVLAVGLICLPLRTRRIVGVCWLVASVAWSATQLGNWESSRALRLHAVSVHPGHVESWHRLAAQAQEDGRYDQAFAYVERGVRGSSGVAPDQWRLFHRGALILRDQGRDDLALTWMRIAARSPEAHKAYANLGLMLARRGNLDEALVEVRKACEYQPLSAHSQRARGIVALEAGEIDEACGAFVQARTLKPFEPDNHFNVGVCELRRGNRSASDASFERALQLDPTLTGRIEEAKRSTP